MSAECRTRCWCGEHHPMGVSIAPTPYGSFAEVHHSLCPICPAESHPMNPETPAPSECFGYPRCDKAQALQGVKTTAHEGPCRCRCGRVCTEPSFKCAWCGEFAAPSAAEVTHPCGVCGESLTAEEDAFHDCIEGLAEGELFDLLIETQANPFNVRERVQARAILARGYVSPARHAAEVQAARAEALREAADEIIAELVCCDVYERRDLKSGHQICYWGGAAASLLWHRADGEAKA